MKSALLVLATTASLALATGPSQAQQVIKHLGLSACEKLVRGHIERIDKKANAHVNKIDGKEIAKLHEMHRKNMESYNSWHGKSSAKEAICLKTLDGFAAEENYVNEITKN